MTSVHGFPGVANTTIRFETPIRLDVGAIARFQPPWVKNAAWHMEGDSTVVEFETDTDSGYHDFKDGTHVVLDILVAEDRIPPTPLPGHRKTASATAINE